MDYTELTRVLNWLLRYGCAREKIVISPEGFVNVNDILDNRFFRGRCSFEDIHVVALNEPFNYECVKNSTTETWKIRALEEHPIKVSKMSVLLIFVLFVRLSQCIYRLKTIVLDANILHIKNFYEHEYSKVEILNFHICLNKSVMLYII